MSEHDEPDRTARERVLAEDVRRLPRRRPDAAFRARLREDFVSGRIGRRRGGSTVRPWFARPLVWLPAAAALLAVVLLRANQGPDWQVLAANGEGAVIVDGSPMAITDLAVLSERLRHGGHVQVAGAATLDVVAPGVVAVAVAPGADLVLPRSPARWWGRTMRADVRSGDAYFSTGKRFHGATLDVTTPVARVRAVGTSFAVLCAPFGTCVCVMEGSVRVGGAEQKPGEGVAVPEGMRRIVNSDRTTETLPILDDSVHHLHRQLASVGAQLGR